uniref:Arrestin-like N-terminal domain-containing protein n=1 Tax=Stegastes partitus TaxID=144197 RepID=A0A3B4ZNW5_9TELE
LTFVCPSGIVHQRYALLLQRFYSICGQVTLEVAKVCRIESLSVKFKGKAEAEWTERHGQTTVVYHSKDKYFRKLTCCSSMDTGKSTQK